MQKLVFFIAILGLWTTASAQVRTRHFESPEELDAIVGDYALNSSPFVLRAMDKSALADEDDKNTAPGPYKFAVNVPVNINSDEHGTWSEGNDTRTWTMKVTSQGAYSQTIIFRQPKLAQGATIHVFDGERKMLFGPINNVNWWGIKEKLVSDVIQGETAYVVYTEPSTKSSPTRLEIMEVCYGYKNIFEKFNNPQDNSPQDLLCTIGDNWRAEARAVIRLLDAAGAFCSASLINNTAQDFTPYVLTADHCNCGGGGAGTFNFQFFFWENTCNTNSPNGGAITFVNGGVFNAARAQTDFLLVTMNDDPSDSGVVYGGWNRSITPATSARGLHHAGGTPMRVAQENNPATIYTSSFSGPCGMITSSSMWRVMYDVGGTSGGSSGSPLFNQGHRVVGQLTGSLNEAPSTTDKKYGRFDLSWTGGGTPSTRLSNWLAPGSSSTTTIGATTRIQGPNDLYTSGAVYSIPDFRNPGGLAYTFTWTVSSNLTISGGQGTPDATIKAKTCNPPGGLSGTITVNVVRNGINVCSATRTVTAYDTGGGLPAAPADIFLTTADCSQCIWNTACSSVPGATSYQWQGSPNLTTTTGPQIAMNLTRQLRAAAVNDCGVGAWKTKSLFGTDVCGGTCLTSGGGGDRETDQQVSDGDKIHQTTFDFQIMPNPADSHSTFSIALPGENPSETFNVKIIDLMGRVVFERLGLPGGNQVLGYVKEMDEVTYFVQVTSSNGKMSTKQLVIE